MKDPEISRGLDSLGDAIDGVMKRRSRASKRVLAITFRRALENEMIRSALARLEADWDVRQSGFGAPFLTESEFSRNFRQISDHPFDAIIAIGGGGVIDFAKCVRLRLATGQDPASFARRADGASAFDDHAPCLIAVPSTAGSGSETTPFAVIYDDDRRKLSVEHPGLLPAVAVLEPRLPMAAPRPLAVANALDALSQSIESFLSVRATADSRRISRQALAEIWPAIPVAFAAGDAESWKRLQDGAYLSGRAISISRTTLAHALSYRLTTDYGVPHGLAVFLCLPAVLAFNSQVTAQDCADPDGPGAVRERLAEIAARLGGEDLSARSAFTGLRSALGVRGDLRHYGLNEEALDRIIAAALANPRASNNPRRPSAASFRPFFQESLDATS